MNHPETSNVLQNKLDLCFSPSYTSHYRSTVERITEGILYYQHCEFHFVVRLCFSFCLSFSPLFFILFIYFKCAL